MPHVIEIYIKVSPVNPNPLVNRAVQLRQSPELIDELVLGGVATVDEIVAEFEDTQLESQFSGTNCFS